MRRHLLAGGLVLALSAVSLVSGSAPAFADDADSSYRPGKGFIWSTEDGRFKLGIGGRIQLRYTHEDFDDDRGDEDLSEFTAERIRFFASGHLFDHWEYKFQTDWGKGDERLKDALINFAQYDAAQFQVGQFKIHFDQQQYISSSRLDLVDRSIAARAFGIGRDVGAQLHGEVADGKFQYAAGVFDGEGENGRNKNDGHLYAVHFGVHPNGDFGYYEGAVKRDEEAKWFLSFAAAWNEDLMRDIDGDKLKDDLVDEDRYVAGFGFRQDRVFLMGEYYWKEMDVDADSDAPVFPGGADDWSADGWYVQLGIMLFQDDWELAMRYSEVDPNEDVMHDTESEITLGVNRYFWDVGHALKVQADVSWLEEEYGPGLSHDDWRVRVQGQLVF